MTSLTTSLLRCWSVLLLVGSWSITEASPPRELAGHTLTAKDSLAPAADSRADARACIENLCWPAAEFQVQLELPAIEHGDLLVRFPSPVPSGDEQNDRVALEWYCVTDEAGEVARAPAVVVVHESGRSMPVGRLFARGFRQRGVHAFMIQLPHYGLRRSGPDRPRADEFITALKQGVADTRRARDAVAALPQVDPENISLQGTSLGGFVSSTTAALDAGYRNAFLTLCGGDLYSILMEGKKDAAGVRERLQMAGFSDAQLREWANIVEPLRVAHRLNPSRTFLYTGAFDDVVPPRNSRLLAEAAKIPLENQTTLPADHYTGIVFLPVILDHMATQIHGRLIGGGTAE